MPSPRFLIEVAARDVSILLHKAYVPAAIAAAVRQRLAALSAAFVTLEAAATSSAAATAADPTAFCRDIVYGLADLVAGTVEPERRAAKLEAVTVAQRSTVSALEAALRDRELKLAASEAQLSRFKAAHTMALESLFKEVHILRQRNLAAEEKIHRVNSDAIFDYRLYLSTLLSDQEDSVMRVVALQEAADRQASQIEGLHASLVAAEERMRLALLDAEADADERVAAMAGTLRGAEREMARAMGAAREGLLAIRHELARTQEEHSKGMLAASEAVGTVTLSNSILTNFTSRLCEYIVSLADEGYAAEKGAELRDAASIAERRRRDEEEAASQMKALTRPMSGSGSRSGSRSGYYGGGGIAGGGPLRRAGSAASSMRSDDRRQAAPIAIAAITGVGTDGADASGDDGRRPSSPFSSVFGKFKGTPQPLPQQRPASALSSSSPLSQQQQLLSWRPLKERLTPAELTSLAPTLVAEYRAFSRRAFQSSLDIDPSRDSDLARRIKLMLRGGDLCEKGLSAVVAARRLRHASEGQRAEGRQMAQRITDLQVLVRQMGAEAELMQQQQHEQQQQSDEQREKADADDAFEKMRQTTTVSRASVLESGGDKEGILAADSSDALLTAGGGAADGTAATAAPSPTSPALVDHSAASHFRLPPSGSTLVSSSSSAAANDTVLFAEARRLASGASKEGRALLHTLFSLATEQSIRMAEAEEAGRASAAPFQHQWPTDPNVGGVEKENPSLPPFMHFAAEELSLILGARDRHIVLAHLRNRLAFGRVAGRLRTRRTAAAYAAEMKRWLLIADARDNPNRNPSTEEEASEDSVPVECGVSPRGVVSSRPSSGAPPAWHIAGAPRIINALRTASPPPEGVHTIGSRPRSGLAAVLSPTKRRVIPNYPTRAEAAAAAAAASSSAAPGARQASLATVEEGVLRLFEGQRDREVGSAEQCRLLAMGMDANALELLAALSRATVAAVLEAMAAAGWTSDGGWGGGGGGKGLMAMPLASLIAAHRKSALRSLYGADGVTLMLRALAGPNAPPFVARLKLSGVVRFASAGGVFDRSAAEWEEEGEGACNASPLGGGYGASLTSHYSSPSTGNGFRRVYGGKSKGIGVASPPRGGGAGTRDASSPKNGVHKDRQTINLGAPLPLSPSSFAAAAAASSSPPPPNESDAAYSFASTAASRRRSSVGIAVVGLPAQVHRASGAVSTTSGGVSPLRDRPLSRGSPSSIASALHVGANSDAAMLRAFEAAVLSAGLQAPQLRTINGVREGKSFDKEDLGSHSRSRSRSPPNVTGGGGGSAREGGGSPSSPTMRNAERWYGQQSGTGGTWEEWQRADAALAEREAEEEAAAVAAAAIAEEERRRSSTAVTTARDRSPPRGPSAHMNASSSPSSSLAVTHRLPTNKLSPASASDPLAPDWGTRPPSGACRSSAAAAAIASVTALPNNHHSSLLGGGGTVAAAGTSSFMASGGYGNGADVASSSSEPYFSVRSLEPPLCVTIPSTGGLGDASVRDRSIVLLTMSSLVAQQQRQAREASPLNGGGGYGGGGSIFGGGAGVHHNHHHSTSLGGAVERLIDGSSGNAATTASAVVANDEGGVGGRQRRGNAKSLAAPPPRPPSAPAAGSTLTPQQRTANKVTLGLSDAAVSATACAVPARPATGLVGRQRRAAMERLAASASAIPSIASAATASGAPTPPLVPSPPPQPLSLPTVDSDAANAGPSELRLAAAASPAIDDSVAAVGDLSAIGARGADDSSAINSPATEEIRVVKIAAAAADKRTVAGYASSDPRRAVPAIVAAAAQRQRRLESGGGLPLPGGVSPRGSITRTSSSSARPATAASLVPSSAAATMSPNPAGGGPHSARAFSGINTGAPPQSHRRL